MQYSFKRVNIDLDAAPAIMGILNLTPDSFFAASRVSSMDALLSRAEAMVSAGVRILDIGGESTRPGAQQLSVEEELERVLSAVERICAHLPVAVSIDTRHAAVAREALRSGAEIVNDIAAFSDPGMAETVAAHGAVAVLMHMKGEPATMQQEAHYDDVVEEVKGFLKERIDLALAAGVQRERIWIDPGIGFAKTAAHSLELIARLEEFSEFGLPVLVGLSRKSFMAQAGARVPEDRLLESCLYNMAVLERGAGIIRVHDADEAARTVAVYMSLRKY
jgi:dihydropteroate synthase